MTISSRTPEGLPNCCPVCGNTFQIEPSQQFGDAPCPSCGTLLWFVTGDTGPRFYEPEASGLIAWIAARLGTSQDVIRGRRWNEIRLDSIDMVEMVMELEDRIGHRDAASGGP